MKKKQQQRKKLSNIYQCKSFISFIVSDIFIPRRLFHFIFTIFFLHKIIFSFQTNNNLTGSKTEVEFHYELLGNLCLWRKLMINKKKTIWKFSDIDLLNHKYNTHTWKDFFPMWCVCMGNMTGEYHLRFLLLFCFVFNFSSSFFIVYDGKIFFFLL